MFRNHPLGFVLSVLPVAAGFGIVIMDQAPALMFRNRPFGVALGMLLVAVGIIILAVWFVKTRSERLTITADELRYEKGILSKAHSELRLTAIRSVKVRQSLLQRVFGTGEIDIYTAGDLPEVKTKGMPDPHEVREIISKHT